MLMTMKKTDATLDLLAERYRAALTKIDGGRAQWIDGTLELTVVVAEARLDLPDHRAFSRWLTQHKLKQISVQDRSALNCFARDLVYARKLLEQSKSISWQQVWRDRPECTPSESRKGASRRKSGWQLRNRIPDVMRDNTPTPPARPAVVLKSLTREQVDPDFKGSHIEFITKYGHVNLQTKQQIEHHKGQEALMAWIGLLSDHAGTARAMTGTVDQAALREWMSKAGKTAKLRGWCGDITRACETIRKIVEENKNEQA